MAKLHSFTRPIKGFKTSEASQTIFFFKTDPRITPNNYKDKDDDDCDDDVKDNGDYDDKDDDDDNGETMRIEWGRKCRGWRPVPIPVIAVPLCGR